MTHPEGQQLCEKGAHFLCQRQLGSLSCFAPGHYQAVPQFESGRLPDALGGLSHLGVR